MFYFSFHSLSYITKNLDLQNISVRLNSWKWTFLKILQKQTKRQISEITWPTKKNTYILKAIQWGFQKIHISNFDWGMYRTFFGAELSKFGSKKPVIFQNASKPVFFHFFIPIFLQRIHFCHLSWQTIIVKSFWFHRVKVFRIDLEKLHRMHI